MAKPPASSIQVIDRVAALLDALARSPEPQSLKRLAADTGLHPSTAYRILDALAAHALVERTDTSQYRLGVKLLRLGSRVREDVDLLREARPIMDTLRSELGETVNLTVREGDEVVYVERSVPARMMRVEQLVGSRAPLHVTAVGKLFLAEGGEKSCRQYARRTGLARYTPNTLTQAARLWNEARESQQLGYALDNEEAELGVACIGVAVRDANGKMVAGLSISAPRGRLQKDWAERVREAGRQLSARLGHTG
jgi:IclR family transcriptional regulator, acetate operon repressor